MCFWPRVNRPTPRAPKDETDLRFWLENMAWHHRYSAEEITAATGMDAAAVTAALERLKISASTKRTWENPPCPCNHADPQFPDCQPGESHAVHGRVSFYQGTGIQAELKRLGEIWKPLERTAK